MIRGFMGILARVRGWVSSRAGAVATAFRGAGSDRLLYDWAVSAMHPDFETRYAIRSLRARARELVRDNPYAAGLVETFTDNIIGWQGIRLQPEVKGRDGKPNRSFNQRIIDAWDDWSMNYASVDGVDDFLDLQRQVIRAWVTDGEVFVRLRRGARNRHAFALQLIDADLLDENYNRPPDESGVEIRMGIEMDASGRRLAYHFWKRHPNDIVRAHERERTRVPASEVRHFFSRLRPGQNRGYSLFAPVLSTLKHVDGYTEAELVAARIAAAKMGFITNETPEAIQAYTARLTRLNDQGEDAEPRTMDVAPGLIEELMPGQRFNSFDPNHPNDAFETFLKVMLRSFAKGFGVSYMTVTGDLEGANYSSMRAGLLPERDHWQVLQVFTTRKLHRPVYDAWRASAMLAGVLQLPSMDSGVYAAHSWRPRGWKWVDPAKDLDAAERGVKLGVNSRTRIAAEQGLDYQKVVDELRDEEEYAESEGVDVSGLKSQTPTQPQRDDDASTNGSVPHRRIQVTEALKNGAH